MLSRIPPIGRSHSVDLLDVVLFVVTGCFLVLNDNNKTVLFLLDL